MNDLELALMTQKNIIETKNVTIMVQKSYIKMLEEKIHILETQVRFEHEHSKRC